LNYVPDSFLGNGILAVAKPETKHRRRIPKNDCNFQNGTGHAGQKNATALQRKLEFCKLNRDFSLASLAWDRRFFLSWRPFAPFAVKQVG
jgi:hypothetical protein